MPYYEKFPCVNCVVFSGSIFNDPQLHDKGRASCFFKVHGYYDKQTKKENGDFKIGLTAFGKTGEYLMKRAKGDTMIVQGKLSGYYMKDKKQTIFNIVAEKIVLHGSNKGYEEHGETTGSVQDGAQNVETPTPRDPGEEEKYNEDTNEAPF